MRNTIIFIIGLLSAIWFALLGMVWMYWAALFTAYPIGLLGLGCWLLIRSDKKSRNKIIPIILITGLILSLSILIGLLLTN